MKITFPKTLLSLALASVLCTPVMAQQTPPASPPPKTEQPKVDPPKVDPPKADPPKADPPKTDPAKPAPQDPKPADPVKTPEQQKQTQEKERQQQEQQKQEQMKKDQPAADPKATPNTPPKDPKQPNNNNNNRNNNSNVNVNVQQNNTRVLNNIQFFNVTTLPERIRVERIYTIYELRDNSVMVTVEGTMGEKRRIYLNEDTFLVTNLKDAADREYPVLLGKESALEKMNLQKGDQLKIEGHDGVVNDKHMLVAFKVTRQGNTINVKIGPDGVIVHEVAKPISN